jgi:hypothetical protein
MRLRRIISYKHTKTVFTEKNFSLIVKKWDLLVDGSRARCHVASIRAAEGATDMAAPVSSLRGFRNMCGV